MYEINDMLGANSGLLCFNNSGNFGECRDFMELYRYYLQYPGRTTAALRSFMRGSLSALLDSHTFRDLYRDYTYTPGASTDINWYDGQIGLGYTYYQGETLQYLGVKLREGEENPPAMMPNTNCKDRSGTILLDDYGLRPMPLSATPGELLHIPVSMEKCYGMQQLGFSLHFDRTQFEFVEVSRDDSVLDSYEMELSQTAQGISVIFHTRGALCPRPCGLLFTLRIRALETARTGEHSISLLPLVDEQGRPVDSFLDKQGNPMSISLVSQKDKYHMSGGWSGVYQEVESALWQQEMEADGETLADLTLLSGVVTLI